MTHRTGSGRRGRIGPARATALAAALAGTALLTAACGGPAAANRPASTAVARALGYAHCMRSHGAPHYPDPNSSGTFMVNPSDSSRFDAPQSTRAACAHLLPRQGQSQSPELTEQQQRQSLALVACMHRNGFPQFPDNWSQWKSGNIGMLVSAGIDPNSPQLNAAFAKCGPR